MKGKEMKKLIIALIGATLLLCMFGCEPSAPLDRTITVEGLTINVPSKWIEDKSDYAVSDSRFGCISFSDDSNESGLSISYSNTSMDQSPENRMKETEQIYRGDPINAIEFEYKIIEESVVDGARCTVYEFAHTVEYEKTGPVPVVARVAYIQSADMVFEVSGYGDLSVFDTALETVKLG